MESHRRRTSRQTIVNQITEELGAEPLPDIDGSDTNNSDSGPPLSDLAPWPPYDLAVKMVEVYGEINAVYPFLPADALKKEYESTLISHSLSLLCAGSQICTDRILPKGRPTL